MAPVGNLNLQKLLSPESVAVIGASERYESPGSVVILNMLARNYSGRIYPINPKYDSIHGLNTYRSVGSLPEKPDCVLICVNAGMVPHLLREAAEFGAGSAVIYASGFKETGESGDCFRTRSWKYRNNSVCLFAVPIVLAR
jgi:acyl-CoA synthetase (NDP forming)